MPMRITSIGASVVIECTRAPELAAWMETAETLRRIIPDGSTASDDEREPADITVEAHGTIWRVEFGGTCVSTHRPEDVLSLAEGFLEVRRQEKLGVCHLHATAVVRNGDAIVIFGGANSGKTTLALSLRQHGWKFAYDDKVLLAPERVELAGGRPYVRAAEHLVLAGLLPPPAGPLLPLPRFGEAPPWRVVALVRPFLTRLAADAELHAIAREELPWEVYPRMSEAISLPRHLRLFDEALPGRDTRALASWRARAVARLCLSCPATEVVGSPSAAALLVDAFARDHGIKPDS